MFTDAPAAERPSFPTAAVFIFWSLIEAASCGASPF
jgi:hypothetical protein